MSEIQYDRQKFGKAVRAFRSGTQPGTFANDVSISPAVLSRVERGRVVEDWVIVKLCKIMGVDIADFPAGRAGDPGSP